MNVSDMYVGKPVRITDPDLIEDVGPDGAEFLVGYIWDIEEDSISGIQIAEVLINTEWVLGNATFLVPFNDYVMGWHLEEVWLS